MFAAGNEPSLDEITFAFLRPWDVHKEVLAAGRERETEKERIVLVVKELLAAARQRERESSRSPLLFDGQNKRKLSSFLSSSAFYAKRLFSGCLALSGVSFGLFGCRRETRIRQK
jgi:hypothetical protein